MENRRIKQNNGFTLIELLLYIALTTIMVGVLGGIGNNVLASRAKANALGEVHYSAQFVLEKIISTVQKAESIDLPAVGATSTTLSLSMTDVSKDPTVFSLSNGVLSIREGSGPTTTLSTNAVQVEEFTITNVSYSNAPDSVRIKMYIEAYNPEGRQEYEARETFYTTVNIKDVS